VLTEKKDVVKMNEVKKKWEVDRAWGLDNFTEAGWTHLNHLQPFLNHGWTNERPYWMNAFGSLLNEGQVLSVDQGMILWGPGYMLS